MEFFLSIEFSFCRIIYKNISKMSTKFRNPIDYIVYLTTPTYENTYEAMPHA